jgi:four helix bundle protein
MENKIKSFTDLTAWERGHELVVLIYRKTDSFPQKEQFSLTDQMRRAAVSITSNIAEGFSRQSQKEKVQFYSMAKASLTELQNQLLIARDIGYLTKEDFADLANQSVQISKLLSGLIRAIKARP